MLDNNPEDYPIKKSNFKTSSLPIVGLGISIVLFYLTKKYYYDKNLKPGEMKLRELPALPAPTTHTGQ